MTRPSSLQISLSMLGLMLCVVTSLAFVSQSSVRGSLSTTSLEGIVSTRAPIEQSANESNSVTNEAVTFPALIELAESMLENFRKHVRDYRAILVKRERISGSLAGEFRMEIKIRNPTDEPSGPGLSAYLKFLEPKSSLGREVIWVENRNDGKLIAHEGGFLNLLRVKLEPDGSMAMMGNKYPITEIGLIRLLEKLIEKCDRGVDLSQCKIDIIEDQKVGDRVCRLFQVTQPRTVIGADFYIAQVFLDVERQVPLRYAAFLWPEKAGEAPPLEEEYTYLDLELNVGLTDDDFEPENDSYNYP